MDTNCFNKQRNWTASTGSFHTHNPPHSQHPTAVLYHSGPLAELRISGEDMCEFFQRQKIRNPLPAWEPVLTSWPQCSRRFSTDVWGCMRLCPASNAPPSSRSPGNHHDRVEWLQARQPYVCNEILRETGVESLEVHHHSVLPPTVTAGEARKWLSVIHIIISVFSNIHIISTGANWGCFFPTDLLYLHQQLRRITHLWNF